MIIDTSQTSGYSFYPNKDDTEIEQTCENSDRTPPCTNDERTVFKSTVDGNGKDNPTDPNNLTEQQMKRSIVFTFEDTECFDMVYSAYCPFEPENKCSWYGGSNFFFAGSAQQITEEGACVPTAAPSASSPTVSTTVSPTAASSESTCQDDPDFAYKDNIKKNCNWIGGMRKLKKKQLLCQKRKWGKIKLYKWCPETCGKVGVGPCVV